MNVDTVYLHLSIVQKRKLEWNIENIDGYVYNQTFTNISV